MERRDRSVKALNRLVYIDSLDDESVRAKLLSEWVTENLINQDVKEMDLELNDLKTLSELVYKNISFLKNYRMELKDQLKVNKKIREFLH